MSDNTEPTVVPPTRVLGLGMGVFLIGFFVFLVAIVFLMTAPCLIKPKIFFRWLSLIMLGLCLFMLFGADRESEYENEGSMTKVRRGCFALFVRIPITLF